MKKYKVKANFAQFGNNGNAIFRLYPDQEIWKGADDYSLCIANPKGDGCAPNQQWVTTVRINAANMSVDEKIAILLNAGIVEEIDGEAD